MKYLLDTTTISDYLRKNASIIKQLHRTPPQEMAISTITKFEIAYGLANKPSLVKKYRYQLLELYQKTNNLAIDAEVAELAGQIRGELKKAGTPIDIPDILIASTARVTDLIVITSNVKHFSKVNKIQIIDWKNSS